MSKCYYCEQENGHHQDCPTLVDAMSEWNKGWLDGRGGNLAQRPHPSYKLGWNRGTRILKAESKQK